MIIFLQVKDNVVRTYNIARWTRFRPIRLDKIKLSYVRKMVRVGAVYVTIFSRQTLLRTEY